MNSNKKDLVDVIEWAEKFIEKHREAFERMHGYASEMKRRDTLAKQLIEMRRKKHSNHSDAREVQLQLRTGTGRGENISAHRCNKN